MTARTACTGVFLREGEGSSVTKLADEACDLFKEMPESQHQNRLEQRIKCETKESHNHKKYILLQWNSTSGKESQPYIHIGKKILKV